MIRKGKSEETQLIGTPVRRWLSLPYDEQQLLKLELQRRHAASARRVSEAVGLPTQYVHHVNSVRACSGLKQKVGF